MYNPGPTLNDVYLCLNILLWLGRVSFSQGNSYWLGSQICKEKNCFSMGLRHEAQVLRIFLCILNTHGFHRRLRRCRGVS